MNPGLLKCRIDVYGKTKAKNEFNEITYDYGKVCSVWAEIKPTVGRETSIEGKSTGASITHKFIIRMGAIKEPRNDMYFEYKGQRYEVMYFIPHYRRNDLIEFYCKLIIEGDKDYGKF